MRGVFITGTNTDVGKTWVGTQLAQHFYDSGVPLTVKKPVESGCEHINGTPHPNDALAYQAITQQPIQEICPYPFEAALSPHQAMRLEGKTLSLHEVVDACTPTPYQTQDDAFLLVEGAGGLMSPIASDGLNIDLAVALNIPIVLVALNELGCLNHTLLTEHAINASGLTLACIVMNHPPHGLHTHFSDGLDKFAHTPVIHTRHPDWLTRLASYI